MQPLLGGHARKQTAKVDAFCDCVSLGSRSELK
jgi:hypothetical protein